MSENLIKIRHHVGSQIRIHRHIRGLTLQMLADMTGVSYQQIQKYESGKNAITVERIWQISHILNVPLFDFYPVTDPEEVGTVSSGKSRVLELLKTFNAMPSELQKSFVHIGQTMAKAFPLSIKAQILKEEFDFRARL